MTYPQMVYFHKLKVLLAKLGIKSAVPSVRKLLTGTGVVLKINGKQVAFAQGVTYADNNFGPIHIIGSDD